MLDLNELSIEDLAKLQNDLPRVLEKKQNEQKKLFIAGIEDLAKKLAITDIADTLQSYLIKLQNKKNNSSINAVNKFSKGIKVAAKYRDPDNPNRTWSGRGSYPKWLSNYLGENPNKTLEDLLIDKDKDLSNLNVNASQSEVANEDHIL